MGKSLSYLAPRFGSVCGGAGPEHRGHTHSLPHFALCLLWQKRSGELKHQLPGFNILIKKSCPPPGGHAIATQKVAGLDHNVLLARTSSSNTYTAVAIAAPLYCSSHHCFGDDASLPVRATSPLSVMRKVCSNCAVLLPSFVAAVHLSGQVTLSGVPSQIMAARRHGQL
jgi:hypothetical protein